jgi:glucosamine 6-phosphate synthetase-like amidotransferase/phosphosugar isomerase protein
MDILSNGFGLIATIFGIVALAGGAAGYFKASRGDSIIKYQETEIKLRDDKILGLEKDVAKFTAEATSKDDTIKKLEEHNKYLQKMGQGSPQLKRLAEVQAKLVQSIDNNTKIITELVQKGQPK